MSLFCGFYIRANGKATLEAVRDAFDELEVEQHRKFIGVKSPDATLKKATKEKLSRLSKMFATDVFWLGFESAADCFEFHHWKSGRHIRSLVYGMVEERTWEQAKGAPEPWERKFLFYPKNMELEEAEDDEQRKKIERIYRDAKIKVGEMVPSISSEMTADAIAHHYGFPHYGQSDD